MQQYLNLYGNYLSFESLKEKFFILWDKGENNQAYDLKNYILARLSERKQAYLATSQDLEDLSMDFHLQDIVREKSLLEKEKRDGGWLQSGDRIEDVTAGY